MIPATNIRIITIVVMAIGIDSTIGLCTLAYCMIAGIRADPTLITAFVGLTSGLSGALTGLLANTRSGSQDGLPGHPIETKITNTESQPVPVAETSNP